MKSYRALIFISLILLYLTSCKQSYRDFELTGVPNRPKWYEPQPLGMAFIPGGSFNMGQNDQDVPMIFNTQTKTVTIDAFWMDITEITNNEYRQFVNWVRDSIAMRLCIQNSTDLEQYFCVKTKKKGEEEATPSDEPCNLNWENRRYLWDPKFKAASDIQTALEPLYYTKQERLFGKKEIDVRKLVYEFAWVDLTQAAKAENKFHYDTLGSSLEKVFKTGNPNDNGLH